MIANAATLTTSAGALRNEEVDRSRVFLRTGWPVAAAVIVTIFALPGDRRIGLALVASILVTVAASVVIHAQLRNPARYSPSKLSALAIACVICGQLGIFYVGYFSAAPLIVVLGLYFFCRTESLGFAIAIYAISAGAHAIEAMLIITGKISDPGLYPVGPRVSVQAQLSGLVIVQAGYWLGFMMARLGRRTSLRAIDQLQAATRLAAQREAQLDELRQDLDHALKIGGPGRFTGHLIGAWQMGAVLGRGAMGEVYEATHSTTGAEAAVKLLRRELLGDRNHVERFLREVRVASSLDSPHVVRVLDASTPEDALPFLAMERLRGQTLSDLLRGSATLPASRLADLISQVGGVLELARAESIVHRDLKPNNLFFTDAGVWKVLDFGVALLGESSGTLTQGAVVGTPGYMAPEQAKGEAVDHRADLYSLGAVCYRCLVGRAPFNARDVAAVLYSVVHQVPYRPSAFVPIGQPLETFLFVALAKSRAARFQTATEMIDACAAAARGDLPAALLQRAQALSRRQPWAEPDNLATRELPRSV